VSTVFHFLFISGFITLPAMKLPPYKNTSLVNIKGERWKDVPGLEGYFMISNFGRVKRLEYETVSPAGRIYVRKEMIISLNVMTVFNHFKKDNLYHLTVSVTLNKISYYFKITRLVYHCFSEPFNMADSDIKIICKEGNGLYIVPANLQMANSSAIQKRMVERNRMESSLKKLTKSQIQKQRAAIVQKLSKQVSQYTKHGTKIGTYSSAADAERATGIHATAIGAIANGKKTTAGGFVWRWGAEKRTDIKALLAQRKQQRRLVYGQKVTQYDFNGNKIACYPSLQDAEAATNANENAIRLVIKGVYKSAKGFYWQSGYGKDKIDLSGYHWGRASMAITQAKKVKQYTPGGKCLQTFNSIKEAAAAVSISKSSIVECCKGRQKTSAGYKWKYT
jgi:NUMOD4 motif/NUMOD1 domain